MPNASTLAAHHRKTTTTSHIGHQPSAIGHAAHVASKRHYGNSCIYMGYIHMPMMVIPFFHSYFYNQNKYLMQDSLEGT
jgi:hypothetical protein